MILFHQQWIQSFLCLSWPWDAASALYTGPLKRFWLKNQGNVCLFAPHRLMQQHKEAGGAVAEGWDQSGGSWGSFWPHITHICTMMLCHHAWLFPTQNTLANAIKDTRKTHVNNFLVANLSGFYLFLFTPCEVWLLIGKSLKLGGFIWVRRRKIPLLCYTSSSERWSTT